MTKFVVFPINPATNKLCKNKKEQCSQIYIGGKTVYCGLWEKYIINNKRCKACLNHDTEVDSDDPIFKLDMKGKKKIRKEKGEK